MSLPLDEVIATLKDHLQDNNLLNAIAKDLFQAERDAKAARADHAGPKAKTRLVALVRQDKGSTTLGGAYIVSVPDDDTTDTYSGEGLLNRLRKAAQEHNDAPRKKRAKSKIKIDTWDALLRNVKAKTFKASGSQIGVKAKGNAHELVILISESIAP